MIIYGVDWSHKEEKIAVFYDGGLLKKEPDYQAGDIVATENMPHTKCVELHHKGVTIYRCNTDLTKSIREENNIEKKEKHTILLRIPMDLYSTIRKNAYDNDMSITFYVMQLLKSGVNNSK